MHAITISLHVNKEDFAAVVATIPPSMLARVTGILAQIPAYAQEAFAASPDRVVEAALTAGAARVVATIEDGYFNLDYEEMLAYGFVVLAQTASTSAAKLFDAVEDQGDILGEPEMGPSAAPGDVEDVTVVATALRSLATALFAIAEHLRLPGDDNSNIALAVSSTDTEAEIYGQIKGIMSESAT